MSERRSMRASVIAALAALVALSACGGSGGSSGEASKAAAPAAASQPAAAPAAPAPAPNAAVAAPGADKTKIGDLIKRYYVRSGQVPEDVSFVVTEVKPSQVTGLSEGTLELSKDGQSQSMPFLITADGRWFLRADPVDLTLDPVQDILKKLKVGADDPSIGPADAKVTIVEFSDFQCPFCARAQDIVDGELLKKYEGKIRFVYKQFPLTQIHPWAEPASLIGLCVRKVSGNDAYWKYHRAVFKGQATVKEEGSTDQLLKMAGDSGADAAKVKACFEAKETEAQLAATLAEAEAVGVNSTPMFFVNGRKLAGAQPVEAFAAIIDPILAGKDS